MAAGRVSCDSENTQTRSKSAESMVPWTFRLLPLLLEKPRIQDAGAKAAVSSSERLDGQGGKPHMLTSEGPQVNVQRSVLLS